MLNESMINDQIVHVAQLLLPPGIYLERSGTGPTGPSMQPYKGSTSFNLTDNNMYYGDGTNWNAVSDITDSLVLGAVDVVPNPNGALITSRAGQKSLLQLEPASILYPGCMTTGVQTIAGKKSFSGGLVTDSVESYTTAPLVVRGSTFNLDGSIKFTNANGNIMVGDAGGLMAGGTNNVIIANLGNNLMNNRTNNILIGTDNSDLSQATEDNRIIIGNAATTQAFIKGISGNTPAGSIAASINSFGALGQIVSSERYKMNIVDMDDSDVIYKFRPRKFNYKNLPEEQSYGFIAEELYEVKPDIITRNRDGEIDAIQSQYIQPMMICEMQKQKIIIDGLLEEVQKLRADVNSLRGL